MSDDAIIKLDHGAINARILAKEVKADFRRVEAASRKIPATLSSPEGKRLFVRFFNSFQLNTHFISVIARTKLAAEVVEKIEANLKEQIEKFSAEVNEAINGAEALCKVHGITTLATYDAESLFMEVKVISSFGRRYMELLTKVDQLMPMLETLAIDEVIEHKQMDVNKALFKKKVRQVAGATRNLASGLRRRMNAMVDQRTAEGRGTKPDVVVNETISTAENNTSLGITVPETTHPGDAATAGREAAEKRLNASGQETETAA